jgi:hypothetical protein
MTSSRNEMDEHRRVKRWRLIYHLRVFDRHSDAMLGHIADVSTEGMMLVGEIPIEVKKDFDLWMEIPLEGGERARVLLRARSLWTKPDSNPAFYKTGFLLYNPSAQVVAGVRAMIEELAR